MLIGAELTEPGCLRKTRFRKRFSLTIGSPLVLILTSREIGKMKFKDPTVYTFIGTSNGHVELVSSKVFFYALLSLV